VQPSPVPSAGTAAMASSSSSSTGDKELNLVWLAHSRLRRRRFDDCIELCTRMLERNPYDQACQTNWTCSDLARLKAASSAGQAVG
jgi:hypothetical protein